MSLHLGDDAPNFTAQTTQGMINLYEYLGDEYPEVLGSMGPSRRRKLNASSSQLLKDCRITKWTDRDGASSTRAVPSKWQCCFLKMYHALGFRVALQRRDILSPTATQ